MAVTDTERVPPGEVMEGDRLPHGLGTVLLRLNDSGTLTYETTTTAFSRDMADRVTGFVREARGLYGWDWQAADARARAKHARLDPEHQGAFGGARR